MVTKPKGGMPMPANGTGTVPAKALWIAVYPRPIIKSSPVTELHHLRVGVANPAKRFGLRIRKSIDILPHNSTVCHVHSPFRMISLEYARLPVPGRVTV